MSKRAIALWSVLGLLTVGFVLTPTSVAKTTPAPQNTSVMAKQEEPKANLLPSMQVQTVNASGANIIYLNAPIMSESVQYTIDQLKELGANATVYLVIESPGGSVVDGARLIDYIKFSGQNIITVCDNFCASMAFQIFEVGKRRLMAPKAILMAHPASGEAMGTIENMHELIKMFKLYVDRLDADVAARIGMPYAQFKALVANNIWVETPEALDMKLADGVVYLNVSGQGVNIMENLINKYSGKDKEKQLEEFKRKLENTKGYQLQSIK